MNGATVTRMLAPIAALLVALSCGASQPSSLSEVGPSGLPRLLKDAKLASFEWVAKACFSGGEEIFAVAVIEGWEESIEQKKKLREQQRSRGERVCEEGETGGHWRRRPGDCNYCTCEGGWRACTQRRCYPKEELYSMRKENQEGRFASGLDHEHDQCLEFFYGEDERVLLSSRATQWFCCDTVSIVGRGSGEGCVPFIEDDVDGCSDMVLLCTEGYTQADGQVFCSEPDSTWHADIPATSWN